MAQPQKAITAGGPMSGTRVINVNTDGSVAAGDIVAFTMARIGEIQFEVAAGVTAEFTATFTPPIFGDSQTGVQPIYPDNSQNEPLKPNNQQANVVASYMISGPGIEAQGPYCVTVGGAYMAIQVDAEGDLTPPQIRIPNSGLLYFNAAAAITFNVSWTGGGEGPFKSPTLKLPKGTSVVHADGENCSVTLSPVSPAANPPAIIKIGSGGGSNFSK